MTAKKVILLIDDDPDILDSTKIVLERAEFAVVTAASGQEGVADALSKKPDLILCDMMMEEIDSGIKVARELRDQGISVPLFLLSSIGDATASATDVNDLGFNGVFQKPINHDFLVSTVKNALK